VQELGRRRDFVVRRMHAGPGPWKAQTGGMLDGRPQGHVARQGHDGDPAPCESGLNGDLEHARHLLGLGDELTVVAALREEMFRMRLLEISAPDLVARNLRRDGQDGDAAAVTVVEPVDQMEVAWTAAPGADRQASGEMR